MNSSKDQENDTAPLEVYLQKAWNTREPIKPFGPDTRPDSPMLRKDRKNRIIYYIGSFNPPHIGHLALIEHVFNNVKAATSSSPSSATSSSDALDAIALVIVLHGERWIERKLHRAAKAASAWKPSPPKSSSPKSRSKSKSKTETTAASSSQQLHLDFDKRYQLVRDSVPDALKKRGVWVLPEDLGEWWMMQNRLQRLCEEDGFEIEFVELLGPDYVQRDRPQCSGMHGVVTSNVCRMADFVVNGGGVEAGVASSEAGGHESSGKGLLQLESFGPWETSRRSGEAAAADVDEEEQKKGKQVESQGVDVGSGSGSRVWVCQHRQNIEYRIWFVQCDEPTMNPDISSTELRRLIGDGGEEGLADRIRDVAMSPELLARFVREQSQKQGLWSKILGKG